MRQGRRDYYDVLGVPRDAEPEEIKQAFRSLARSLHPDLSPDPDANERFSEIAKAYGVLSKPTARLLYDRFGYLGPGNGGFAAENAAGRSRAEDLARVFNVSEVEIDEREAARGTTRNVRATTIGICSACHGEGTARGAVREECTACGGAGHVTIASPLGTARLIQVDTCAECSGSGRVVIAPCATCVGTGWTKAERKVKLRIPPGADHGKILRAPVDRSNGDAVGEPRDVYIVLRVRPDADPRIVRYTAAAALALAIALFVVLLVAPESLVQRL